MIYCNMANDVITAGRKLCFLQQFSDEYSNPLFCNYECSTKNVMQFLPTFSPLKKTKKFLPNSKNFEITVVWKYKLKSHQWNHNFRIFTLFHKSIFCPKNNLKQKSEICCPFSVKIWNSWIFFVNLTNFRISWISWISEFYIFLWILRI